MTGTATYAREEVRAAIEETLVSAGFTPRDQESPGFVIGAGRRRCDGTTSTFAVSCSRANEWGEFEHTRPDLVDQYGAALEAAGWAVELDDVETYVLRVAPGPKHAFGSDLPWDAPEHLQCRCGSGADHHALENADRKNPWADSRRRATT